jgi:hypothetical protein
MAVLLVVGLISVIAVIGVGDAGAASTILLAVIAVVASVGIAAVVAHVRARRQLVWATPLDGLPQLWDEHDEGTVGPRRSPRHAA